MSRRDEIVRMVGEGKSQRQIARELGLHRKTVQDHLQRAKGHFPAPEGHTVKGVSTLYDQEGEVRAQWVKTRVDEEALRAAQEAAIKVLSEKIPRQVAIVPPARVAAALCNLYTLTDTHCGMHAWHKEGGADWDLKIFEATIGSAFDSMVASAPKARVAVVNQLGDFLHTDGLTPSTPTSGHVLDADSRFPKMVQVAVRTLRRLINAALVRHELVHVILAEGNHDIASSVWLREVFGALYENEPRVTVEKSPLPYYAFQHGKTMLAFHHGHLRRVGELPLLFAAQFAKMWGKTLWRYAHTGHLHHVDEKEHPGIVVTQHPTLAARDAYAARGGWIAARAAQAITYHDEFGEVGRVRVSPEMVGQ